MIQRLRTRIAKGSAEGGFTLIELLVVIIILGILLAVAVPSYLQFKNKAEQSAAKSNVRAAVPAIEAYYSDNGSYANIGTGNNPAGISTYDPSSARKVYISTSPAPTGSSYCVYAYESAIPGPTWFKLGPAGDITRDNTAPYTDCAA